MSGAGKFGPREPVAERLKRLGIKLDPSNNRPQPRYRSRRHWRELDEITFSKPNTNKTDNEK